jgi:hypothetical protein
MNSQSGVLDIRDILPEQNAAAAFARKRWLKKTPAQTERLLPEISESAGWASCSCILGTNSIMGMTKPKAILFFRYRIYHNW